MPLWMLGSVLISAGRASFGDRCPRQGEVYLRGRPRRERIDYAPLAWTASYNPAVLYSSYLRLHNIPMLFSRPLSPSGPTLSRA